MRIDLLTPALVRRLGDRERGATLLISIAILTLLFVFSMAFVRLVNFERSASANYTDAVRARMLARAGLERAIVEMQRVAGRRHYSHPGMPSTRSTEAAPADVQGDGWAYSDALATDCPQPGTYTAATKTFTMVIPGAGTRNFPLDIHSTLMPSFRRQDVKTFYGAPLVYSGMLGESYAGGVDIYKLKILDTARMLDLNHPDGVAVRRMFKNLLRSALGIPLAQAQGLANVILDRRPLGGFKSKAEIESMLITPPGGTVTGITADNYRRQIRDLITVYAWRDPRVIRPWAVNCSAGEITADLGPGYTAGPNNLVEPAQRLLAVAPSRAPININTAPIPVLVAMFAEARATTERFGTFSITFAGAQQLAQAIVNRRTRVAPYTGTSSASPATLGGPFRTWNEFERFVDALNLAGANFPATVITAQNEAPILAGGPHRARSEVPTHAASYVRRALDPATNNQGVKDLIKAIANPNTMVSKFGMPANHGGGMAPVGPGATLVRLPRMVDKSDITSLTTEGCFDAMGVFEITSIGMVMIPEENPATALRLVAAQTEQKVLKVYDVFRLSTQQDFEANRAFMVKGDFIEALDKGWKYEVTTNKPSVHGLNKADHFNFVGWPGIVTWPGYSLDRNDTNNPSVISYSPKAEYVMAPWDGYMTLSNLIAYVMQDMDFIIGFARASLDAIKVRAWCDPRHQFHNGVNIPYDPADGTVDDDGDGWIDEKFTRPANAAEIDRLARPLNRATLQSRTKGVLTPAEVQLIDEDPAAAPNVANDLFLDGTSLWNTGVAIHPFRKDKDPASPTNGIPQFFAYDSGNIDLGYSGTSMRFWVQPLVDPYLQDEEVLCSFVGSRGKHTGYGAGGPNYTDRGLDPANISHGANVRDNGFRIIKEVTAGGQVVITMDLVGNPFPWTTLSSFSIPVTPQFGQNDPLRPEWIPGSWHWVVFNYGPRPEPGSQVFDVTLQVDMVQTLVAAAPQIVGSSGVGNFGELHGNIPNGDPSQPFSRGPLVSSGPSTTQAWIGVRVLGDWYNCEATTAITFDTVSSSSGPHANGVVLNGAGTGYTAGPGWQTNVFPADSYDHEVILLWHQGATVVTDPIPHDPNGAPMTQTTGGSGYSGWSYSFTGTEMGTDSAPGGHEWEISVLYKWKTTQLNAAFCACCTGPIPTDPGYLGTDPRNLYAKGANVNQASCNHDSTGTSKCGVGQVLGAGSSAYYCLVYEKTPITGLTGSVPNPRTINEQCDDCHGCENCDVDGPIFFGGEPVSGGTSVDGGAQEIPPALGAGQGNYGGPNVDDGAAPQGYDVSTMAYAVFDNIMILNNSARRTDNVANSDDFYEDRFFETTMSFIVSSSSSGAARGFGAQYHRGLLELLGEKARLGTLTWTAYPSTEDLRFEVGLFRVDAFDGPIPTGNPNFDLAATTPLLQGSALPFAVDPALNPGPAVDGWSDSPIGGAAHVYGGAPVVGDSVMPFAEVGLDFQQLPYDGEGQPTVASPKLLVLGIRLRDLPPAPTMGTAAAGVTSVTIPGFGGLQGSGTKGQRSASVPQPLLSSPVFEDVTLTLIPERTTTLYAEEGVEE